MSKLFSTTCVPALTGPKDAPYLRRYVQEEDGFVTLLAVLIIGLLVLIAGISFDMQRNEMERVRIQNTADRAVLAAADLDQTLTPTEVVQDYFDKAGVPQGANTVVVDEGLNYRTVSVDTDGVTATNFMSMLGIDELPVRSFAEAEERVNNVEISLVLDISGSMGWNNKMTNLRDAAGIFVDTVINPSTEDLVSISIVPYSENVSAGPEIMNALNVNRVHDYSSCVEFEESDFSKTTISATQQYEQVQHFYWGSSYSNNRSNPVCLYGADESIVAFSQDTTELKRKIGKLEPRGNTSIFLGMKWAAALLDPEFRTVNEELAMNNVTDPDFIDRPAAFSDHETLKTVILMTDGENTSSFRIPSQYYANYSHRAHWNRYNLDYYIRYYWSGHSSDLKYTKYWNSYGDSLLSSVCDAAKEKKIVIWSIGFEVSDHGANVMRDCASSPSHFFRVEGVEIKEAFKAIARQINQLRLTQ
ncbi:Tad domain-containing protein [Sulfitobacter sp.]|uniref:Tad domain-containing protein n=1 Tax=Sulfitobacter sp. TaxID=1903071 RepID=UPI003001C1CA